MPPPTPVPERRGSQMFSNFGISSRSSRQPWTPRPLAILPNTPPQRPRYSLTRNRSDLSAILGHITEQDPITDKDIVSLERYVSEVDIDFLEVRDAYFRAVIILSAFNGISPSRGYDLLEKLFTHQDVPRSLRFHLVTAVGENLDHSHAMNLPRCLNAAIQGGRDIDGVEQVILLRLTEIARRLLHYSEAKPDTFVPAISEQIKEALHLTLVLLKDTVFIGTALDFTEEESVIASVNQMLLSIKDDDDALELLNVINSFIGRGEVSELSLNGLVSTLCSLLTTATLSKRHSVVEKTKDTMTKLVGTHLKENVLKILAATVKGLSTEAVVDPAVANGALLSLALILADRESSKNADFVVRPTLEVLQQLDFKTRPEVLLSSAILIQTLVEQTHQFEKIINNVDWDVSSGAFLTVYKAVIARRGKLPASSRAEIENAFRQLSTGKDLSPRQRHILTKLTLSMGQILPVDLVEAALRDYIRPQNISSLQDEVRSFSVNFIQSKGAPLHLRLFASDRIAAIVQDVQQINIVAAWACVKDILNLLKTSIRKSEIQTKLVQIVVDFVTKTVPDDHRIFYEAMSDLFEAVRECSKAQPSDAAPGIMKPGVTKPLAAGIVLVFLRTINSSAFRSRWMMDRFLELLERQEIDPSGAVMLYRILFRLRSDISSHMYLVASPEGEGLAAHLARASRRATEHSRRQSKASTTSDVGPTWKYGDIVGLPESPPKDVSRFVTSVPTPISQGLDMPAWLSYAITVLDQGADWEMYSYTIVHLGAQLTNQTLFVNARAQICELRALLCKQLLKQTIQKPPEHTELRQADVAICLYHILTMLIGYQQYFSRQETEEMISAFIMGLTAWDRTTVPCVHALTLCCYELPDSLQRDLVRIVSQMATIVTKAEAAVHVLEFLAGLSRLTDLARTFRGDEIKVVFGVCFSYIDYVRGKRLDEAQQKTKNSLGRNQDRPEGVKTTVNEVPDYVFALAYHVITFWYLALQKSDREKYLSWMEQRLLSTDETGQREEQALVTLDFAWRITKRIGKGASLIAPAPLTKTATSFVTQYSLTTIDMSGAGAAHLIERRASGTDEWTEDRDAVVKTIAHLRGQVVPAGDGPFPDVLDAVLLDMSDAAVRGITLLDQTSPIDFFKAGVLYVGEDQFNEPSILSNIMGSPDYNAMLHELGVRLPLAKLPHDSCGLDRNPELLSDGDHTIWFRDGVTALIYHVATLMPTTGPECLTRKKSHIGNDFVSIVFNNSGAPYDFNTLPSAFNYVYIVVAPEARTTFIETRTRGQLDRGDDWFEKSWFKVQIMVREDFMPIGSASEAKVVSGKALGMYVRNLVLNACIFANVWAKREGGGGMGGSWKARLDQLRMIRERFGAKQEPEVVNGGEGGDVAKKK